ncbi:MAG: phosphoribosylaminoimidazolesuccinocarboxamide synthase [Chloroflexota bacterium]
MAETNRSNFSSSSLSLEAISSGKVRDIYRITKDRLLLVTTDRISAFDRVLGTVPYKGQVLNQLTAWWMEQTRSIIPNHMLDLPDENAMVVKQADPLTIEVIIRGYITGVTKTALWYRYNLGERNIYGHQLPEGLKKNQELPSPLITPTTKGGPSGHDERLTVDQVVTEGHLDAHLWDQVQKAALALFKYGQQVALQAGLILVDTKYEFGKLPDGSIVLIDEIHTPDSSRFWLANSYQERFGAADEPENYDKEFLRLEYAKLDYRGEGEPPEMPKGLWNQVSDRYIDLYEKLTGQGFFPGETPVSPRLTANLKKSNYLD